MHTTTSRDGTNIAYDVAGTGEPLVYVTGATVFRNFAPIRDDVKVFSRCFRVYSYDRRGRGDSGSGTGDAPEHEIADLEAVIDATGGSAYLYGHSSGAMLALEAALRVSQKVRRVVLYDAPYLSNDEERLWFSRLGDGVKKLLDEGSYAKAIRSFLKGIGMPAFFTWLLPFLPGWKSMVALAPTLAYDIALAGAPPPLDRVPDLAVPALFLSGQKTRASIGRVSRALAEASPLAEYREVAGQDHLISAKVLLPILRDFCLGDAPSSVRGRR